MPILISLARAVSIIDREQGGGSRTMGGGTSDSSRVQKREFFSCRVDVYNKNVFDDGAFFFFVGFGSSTDLCCD